MGEVIWLPDYQVDRDEGIWAAKEYLAKRYWARRQRERLLCSVAMVALAVSSVATLLALIVVTCW